MPRSQDLYESSSYVMKGGPFRDCACLPDAQTGAGWIGPATVHRLAVKIERRPQYGKGRPKADGTGTLKETRFGLKITVSLDQQAMERLREQAVCFVHITDTPVEGQGVISAREVLTIYQDQHSVESNFAFLKDPVCVNALFLKSPRRIEALELMLVLALLFWRLMERTIRLSLAATKSKVTGWEKRQTPRPTSLIITRKFLGVLIVVSSSGRRLARPRDDIQLQYLKLLELTPHCIVTPYPRKERIRTPQ